jgi:hypothetical protein
MKTLFGALAVLFLVACGGGQQQTTTAAGEMDGAPEWVLTGCGAFGGEKMPVCGVGIFTGSKNFSLARDGAVARARNDLARNIDTTVKALYKDYQATTTGGEQFNQAAADEQHVSSVSKQIVNMRLSGTTVAKVWHSKSANTWAALVKLDPENLKDQLAQIKDLNEKVRQAVVKRAEAAHKELDAVTADPQ